MASDNELNLLICPKCNGTGEQECCGGHMCPGTTKCYRCDGKGKILSEKDRRLKEQFEELLKYK